MAKKVQTPKIVKKNRFVLSRKMCGQGLTIEFTNKKGETYSYNHDDAVDQMPKEAFDSCFTKYGNYTNTNKLPKWYVE